MTLARRCPKASAEAAETFAPSESGYQAPPVRFRQIRPGLYERIDTPHRVEITPSFLAAIRAESPWLADWLEAAERGELQRRLDEMTRRRWWKWWGR